MPGAAPIDTDTRSRPFLPFGRGLKRGEGLGLYIAAEIARAHGGTLSVESDAAETRFTFSMACSGPGEGEPHRTGP